VSPISPIPAMLATPATPAILTTPLRRTPRVPRSKTVSSARMRRVEDASRGEQPGAKRGVQ